MRLLSLLTFALVGFLPVTVMGQGQTFSNCTDWEAATCGDVVESGMYEAMEVFFEEPPITAFVEALPQGFQLNYGTLTQDAFPDVTGVSLPQYGFWGTSVLEIVFENGDRKHQTYFEPDPELGIVEGFCFKYSNDEIVIDIFDGETLIESVTSPGSGDPFVFNEFGWLNVDGVNVTRVAINAADNGSSVPGDALVNAPTFSFGEYCPPFTMPEIVGGEVIDEIDALIDAGVLHNGQGNPVKNFITQALRHIGKGKIDKAIEKLQMAIERLQELIDDGALGAVEGQDLIDMLQSVIDNL